MAATSLLHLPEASTPIITRPRSIAHFPHRRPGVTLWTPGPRGTQLAGREDSCTHIHSHACTHTRAHTVTHGCTHNAHTVTVIHTWVHIDAHTCTQTPSHYQQALPREGTGPSPVGGLGGAWQAETDRQGRLWEGGQNMSDQEASVPVHVLFPPSDWASSRRVGAGPSPHRTGQLRTHSWEA